MKMWNGVAKRLRSLLPRFLQDDYSPYKCSVSANRENYDLRGRAIHLQNLIKTWINTRRSPFLKPVECKDCLFDTRIPNIYIGRNGLCNMCMTYKKNFKPEILASELETFLNTPREEGTSLDAAVAFSGGKDSSMSLLLARRRFNLDLVAVLVDNGFIPKAVIENGRNWCTKLGVELVVLDREEFVYDVKEMMDQDFRNGYPCFKCGALFHDAILKYCAKRRINRVILGRNWWRWIEPEVRSVRRVKDRESDLEVQFLSLPFALQLNDYLVKSTLENEGWTPVKIHGNSTNCLIPGLVASTLFKRLGYHPELNLLSREVIVGYLEKEKAKQDLMRVKDMGQTLRLTVDFKIAQLHDKEMKTGMPVSDASEAKIIY